jgi:hypothetical protein
MLFFEKAKTYHEEAFAWGEGFFVEGCRDEFFIFIRGLKYLYPKQRS